MNKNGYKVARSVENGITTLKGYKDDNLIGTVIKRQVNLPKMPLLSLPTKANFIKKETSDETVNLIVAQAPGVRIKKTGEEAQKVDTIFIARKFRADGGEGTPINSMKKYHKKVDSKSAKPELVQSNDWIPEGERCIVDDLVDTFTSEKNTLKKAFYIVYTGLNRSYKKLIGKILEPGKNNR